MAKKYSDSSKADYIKSDIRNFFKVDEDDNLLERGLKGAGSTFGETAVNTGANIGALITDSGLGNYIPGWDGGDVETDLTEDDFFDAVLSVPALKGLAASPAALRKAYKIAQKGGLQKGFSSLLKSAGPGNSAAKRTSLSQLASLGGLGRKSAGKTIPGAVANRGMKLAGAGYVGNEILDRAGRPNEVSLDQPELLDDLSDIIAEEGADQSSAAPMVNPTIDEPAGPTPGTGEFTAAEQIEVDPKDKSPGAFQRRNIKKALLADASRKVNDRIQQNKMDDRRAASAKNRMDLLEDRYDSTGGRMPGAWAALSPEQKAQMAENYQTNSYYNSADEARKESLEALERSGGSFVDPNDPTNQNKLPGQVSLEEFSKNTGLTQEGTGITQNADGSYATLETGKAFENAGGLDTARDVISNRPQQGPLRPTSPKIPDEDIFNQVIQNTLDKIKNHKEGGSSIPDDFPEAQAAHSRRLDELNDELARRRGNLAEAKAQANEALANSPRPRSGGMEGEYAKLTNLERQTEGGDKSYRDQYGEGPDLSPDTVRLSSDMADYADAGFQNKEDALKYLNRGAVDIDNPAPAPTPTPTYQPEEEDSGSDWWKYVTGGLGTAAALHPATRKWAKNLFTKKQPVAYPPGRNKIFNDAVARNARPGTVKNPGGLGQPGSMQKAPVKPPVNPWSSASQNARPRAKTPQDAGFDARIDAMSRPDLVRAVGPRTADGRRVATTEELRRRYKALNRKIF